MIKRGDRVRWWGRNAAAEDSGEWLYGTVASDAAHLRRIDGCGDLVPHVRVDPDHGERHALPVARLRLC